MGFETVLGVTALKNFTDLNFVPMGFETYGVYAGRSCDGQFELCPYGIWNALENSVASEHNDLNFVPMGFETSPIHPIH